MCLAVWAQQAFGDWMRPPSWVIGHTSINMSPGSDKLKVGYPAPVVRRTGIKWCYVCVPRRPHTTVDPLEACWPEVRGIAIYVHSNPEKKMSMARSEEQQFMSTAIANKKYPWRGPRNSNLCPQQSRKKNIYIHGEVQRTAIYVHSNPEKCPWRGPRNSNLCPQQSRIMSMATAEEQQYMSTAIQKYVHSEVRRTAIIQQSRKQLSMAYIQMTSEESAKLRCVEMMYQINWKIKQKQQQKPLSEKVSIQF